MDKLSLNIELADNGIIIRSPYCEDDVEVVQSEPMKRDMNGVLQVDRTKEYGAIGRRIYDWLMDVVSLDHNHELIITNFSLEIKATPKGRKL